jgi:hypothetical protein
MDRSTGQYIRQPASLPSRYNARGAAAPEPFLPGVPDDVLSDLAWRLRPWPGACDPGPPPATLARRLRRTRLPDKTRAPVEAGHALGCLQEAVRRWPDPSCGFSCPAAETGRIPRRAAAFGQIAGRPGCGATAPRASLGRDRLSCDMAGCARNGPSACVPGLLNAPPPSGEAGRSADLAAPALAGGRGACRPIHHRPAPASDGNPVRPGSSSRPKVFIAIASRS